MYSDVVTANQYTLVVGAGVNTNRNVPGWSVLVRRAWKEVFGEEKDYRRDLAERLKEARDAIKEHCGWPEEDLQRLDLPIHPLEPQFALELIDREIAGNPEVAERLRQLTTGAQLRTVPPEHMPLLPRLLAHCLYENVKHENTEDTLSEVARFVRRSKRLIRVISLNVDNLLELEVNSESRNEDDRFLEVISRQRHRPSHGIPTYHLHGFLPLAPLNDSPIQRMRKKGESPRLGMTGQTWEHMTEAVPEGLVFTDSQYWASAATPLSFANFVFAQALHDSSCVFIGLSMTDLNLVRWLGLSAIEFGREYERELTLRGVIGHGIRSPYIRHCWIRPDSADSSGLITDFLSTRGVDSHRLRSWEANEVRSALNELLEMDD